MTRRTLLAALLATACSGVRPASPEDRAADWLATRQGEDGGFHSTTYGLFRPGHSLTALVLLATARPPLPPGWSRAATFLAAQCTADGALGLTLVPDYPVYATALWIRGVARWGPPGWRQQVAASVRWLLAQQLVGDAWGDHPARGGFTMGSASPRTPPHAGHVDLSMTRHALGALRAAGLADDHPAFVEGRAFVLRCGTPDGGFRYSPEPALNKGASPESGYGTATCDGILALRAVGGAADRERAAVEVLRAWFRVDENPGVAGAWSAYGKAMRFLWRASAAEVLVSTDPERYRELVERTWAEQQADGCWRNEAAMQKEDDPLVATGLALLALDPPRGP